MSLMKGGVRVMYSEIRLLMLKNKISMQDIGKELNLHRNTISQKINGKAEFTLDEMLKIRDKFFANATLDELSVKV